jgi:dephospho-CoA kinase
MKDMKNISSPSCVLGITGGAAAGKSTVLRLLGTLGAQTVDADTLVRWAYLQEPFREAVRERFGDDVFRSDGSIDREALAAIVFNDPAARTDLEGIVHPAVLDQMLETAEEYRAEPERAPVLALEIPLLYEVGAEKLVDAVLVVTAPEEVRRQRLRDRGWDDDRIDAVFRAQMPEAEKIKRADLLLDGSGDPAKAAAQVEALWASIRLGEGL